MGSIEIQCLANFHPSKRYEVAEFIVNQFNDLFSGICKDKEKLISLFEQALVETQCFVAIDKNRIIGLITISNSNRSSLVISRQKVQQTLGWIRGWMFYLNIMQEPLVLKPNDIYISTLAVHKEHRRKGIATQLLNCVVNESPQNQYLLEVIDVNEGAIKLYESLGFRVFKRTKQRFAKQAGFNERLYMKKEGSA